MTILSVRYKMWTAIILHIQAPNDLHQREPPTQVSHRSQEQKSEYTHLLTNRTRNSGVNIIAVMHQILDNIQAKATQIRSKT